MPIDTLVIGAGLVGACVARALAESGRAVTVATAQGVAEGATRRSIGLVTADPEHPAATEAGVRDLLAWAGRLNVAVRPVTARWYPNRNVMQLDDPAERVDSRPAALMDLAKLTLRLLMHPAITVRQHVEIQAIERPRAAPLSPLEAIVPGERLFATRIVLAANAYAGLLSPYLADAMTLARGAVWVSRPLDPGELPGLAAPVVVGRGRLIAAQTPDGRVRIGSWTVAGAPLAEDPDDLTRRFLKRNFPAALDEIAWRQTGVSSESRDGEPLVGRLPGETGVMYALGAGPFGAAWAMSMAARIAGMS
jgi:glycine/D-amino acid oxidase-like deaminating enzyme